MSADLLAPPYRARQPLFGAKELVCGVVAVRDLDRTRAFYEDVLGLECIRVDDDRMLARTDAERLAPDCKPARWILDVRQTDEIANPQRMLNHWGLDVTSKDAVDQMHARILLLRDEFGIGAILEPSFQHAAYSFYFQDEDSNWWEYQFMPPQVLEFSFARGDLPL